MKGFLVLVLMLALGLLYLGLRPSRAEPAPPLRIVEDQGSFPLTLEFPSGKLLVLEESPQRILAANAATVDFVAALIGPERLVALPAAAEVYSSLATLTPAEMPAWEELPRFQGYQAEIVLGYGPDLVLAHSWQAPETTAALVGAGVPVLVSPLPASWDEILATLDLLGPVLDARERAKEMRADLEERRERLANGPLAARGLTALSYSNLGAGGTTAGAGTTADVLFGLVGLRNAATDDGLRGHETIDHERLLALDPDVIVVGTLEDSGERPPSETYLRNQPALVSLTALREDRIVALPPRLFTTTSLALMESAERLAEEVARRLDD